MISVVWKQKSKLLTSPPGYGKLSKESLKAVGKEYLCTLSVETVAEISRVFALQARGSPEPV